MRRTWPSTFALLVALVAGTAAAQEKDDPFKNLYGEDRDAAGESLPEEPVARAAALLDVGRHDEAEALLEGALQKDAKDGRALAHLGRLRLEQGDLAEAAAVASRMPAASPEAQLLAGTVAESRGDLAAASQAWRQAWGITKRTGGPAYLEACVRLGELTYEAGKADDAADFIEQALAHYRDRDDLSAVEFVWVARACRQADLMPAIKKDYQQGMVKYARRMLDQALIKDPRCLQAHVEAGQLALLKFDIPMAKAAFEKALGQNPNHADARVGLARTLVAQFYAGEGKYGDAATNLRAALAIDPTHAGALALLGTIAATDGELDQALEHAAAGRAAHPRDVELLAVEASVLLLRGDAAGFAALEREVLAARPRCARFFEHVANIVTLKFRYAEARDLSRRALEVNPDYHPVLAILGVSLSRTGDEEEGRRVLQRASQEDPYNVFTFNALQLFDVLEKKYTTVEVPGFTIRLHKDEAPASARYVVALCQEARERLGKRYGAWPEKVLVEVFPEHADFSARSVGIPGIPALGVCFGDVVTVLSAGEKDAVGQHAWGRTLWHELTHVATLTRTKNRVPRWLTEGLSVFEEPRGRPAWVRDFDRDILTLMQRGLLLPVAKLDQGFTKPSYGGQVIMSYYQAGVLCEFIDQRWGFEAILRLLDAFAAGKATSDAVRAACGIEPEALDGLFLQWLQRRYQPYAFLPPPGLEERSALLSRLQAHPWDVAARGALARVYALQGSPADAEMHADLALRHAQRALGPWTALAGVELGAEGQPGAASLAQARLLSIRAGAGDAYLALGILATRRGRPALARRHVDRALELGTRDAALAHQLLAQLLRARQRWRDAANELEVVARLVPPTPDVHRMLHATWAQAGDQARAMAHLRRVCALDSNDAAARKAYAEWAKAQGRWADVAEVLDDSNLIDPFQADVHVLLADALRRTATGDRAKLERALVEYTAALDLKIGYQAGPLFGQAACLAELGRAQEALEKAKAAVEADPEHQEARALKEKLEGGRR